MRVGNVKPLAGALIALSCLIAATAVGPAAGAGRKYSVNAKGTMVLHVSLKGRRVRARVASTHKPLRLKVTLNGHSLTRLFAGRSSRSTAVTLGRGDFLRRGRNTLVASVELPSGHRVHRVRRFRLPKSWVVPDASRPRRIYAGERIRLSAARSLGTRAGGRLKFRWRITSRPKHSRTKLRGTRSKRPSLRPDKPGRYRIRLVARPSRGRVRKAGVDTTEVAAVDPKATRAGVFVGTTPFTTSGPATSLQFFGSSLKGQYPLGRSSGPVVTFFLDRQTLAPVGGGPIYTGVAASDVATLTSAYAKARQGFSQPIVISAGNNYGKMSTAFANWLRTILGASGIAASAPSFALAGTPPDYFSLKAGSAPVSNMQSVSPDAGGASRLAGIINRDVQDNWVFRPSSIPAFGAANGTEVRFDTASSSGLTVAGQSYSAATIPPSCAGFGGYQLLVLNASGPNALQPVPLSVYVPLFNVSHKNGDTFMINSCSGGNSSFGEALALRGMFNQINGLSQPVLIFIQSVGNSHPQSFEVNNSTSFLAGFGSELRAWGGTPKAFVSQLNPGQSKVSGPYYSFVGRNFKVRGEPAISSTAEVSTESPGAPPARLIGALVKDPYGNYIPTVNTAVGSSANDPTSAELRQPILLSHVAAMAPPATNYSLGGFPNSTNQAWQAALQDAAAYLGLEYQPGNFSCYRPPGGVSDVRSAYCGGVPLKADVSRYWSDLFSDCSPTSKCLEDAPYVANKGYSSAVWSAMKQQLALEFPLVDHANQLAAALKGNLSAAMVSDTITVSNALQSRYKKLAQARLRPEGTGRLSWASDILDAMAAAAAFFSDDVSDVLWNVSAGIGVGADAVTDSAGTPLMSGLDGTTAGSLDSQINNQIEAANLLGDKERDAVVSSWNRLQAITPDFKRLPKSEDQDADQAGTEFANIRYVWRTLMGYSVSLNHLLNNGGIVNPQGTSIQAFQCPGPGGLQKPYAAFGFPATDVQYDGGNYALTVLTPDPSGSFSDPAPAAAFPQIAAPAAVLNQFFAAQPSPGTPLSPVTNGAPPGLGIDSRIFLSRMIAQMTGAGTSREVNCNSGHSGPN